jgi:glycosyltransferase involved in cell wall biosynthesis
MMTEKLPHVSICLLTYNRAALLPGTLDSLLAQTHVDFELIVNDDRSPDNTEDICREYMRRDPRIRYFKNAVNLRYAGNQNAAVLRATSDYVAIVHDGDIYRPDLIEKWTRALVKQPGAALVFNALESMDENGRVVRVHRHPYGPLVPGRELFDDMIRRPDSPIFGIVMVRKPCVLTVGPFDPRISTLADIDMWLRLLLRYDAAYIAEPLLRIAPREAGHHNTLANWNVRGQQELIYALNSARRYPGDTEKVAELRHQISPMIWKMRFRALLDCLRQGKIQAFVQGVAFSVHRLNFASGDLPDSVLDWGSCTQDSCEVT